MLPWASSAYAAERTLQQEALFYPNVTFVKRSLSFYVLGDTPYSEEAFKTLQQDLADIPDDAAFVAHVGDLNRVKHSNCSESWFSEVHRILLTSKDPVFIIPGDNDWLDCPDDEKKYLFEDYFGWFEDNWDHSLKVTRQYFEADNFAFFLEGTLFLGFNMVGRKGDKQAMNEQLKHNQKWALRKISQSYNEMESLVIFGHQPPRDRFSVFFDTLVDEIRPLGIPTLYIHGDGHKWEFEENMFGVPAMIRIQVDEGEIAPPLKVTLHRGEDGKSHFHFDRRLSTRAPPPTPTMAPTREASAPQVGPGRPKVKPFVSKISSLSRPPLAFTIPGAVILLFSFVAVFVWNRNASKVKARTYFTKNSEVQVTCSESSCETKLQAMWTSENEQSRPGLI